MDRLVEMVAHDRASASGIVDGNLALRLQVGGESRVVLGLSDGQWIQERVVAALSDFEYSRLVLDVVHEDGTSQLHARLSGHGATTPQELDLSVNVDDLQLLLDESVQLLPTVGSAEPPT